MYRARDVLAGLTAGRNDCYHGFAGWSSLVARWAHNPKVGGSNPPPATNLFNHLALTTTETKASGRIVGAFRKPGALPTGLVIIAVVRRWRCLRKRWEYKHNEQRSNSEYLRHKPSSRTRCLVFLDYEVPHFCETWPRRLPNSASISCAGCVQTSDQRKPLSRDACARSLAPFRVSKALLTSCSAAVTEVSRAASHVATTRQAGVTQVRTVGWPAARFFIMLPPLVSDAAGRGRQARDVCDRGHRCIVQAHLSSGHPQPT